MQELDRGEDAPRAGPDIWVRRLAAGESAAFAICSPAIWQFWVHWAGNHSEPCFKDHKKCPGHRKGLPRRWKGYLYIVNHTARRCEFLEITPAGSEQLISLCGDKHSFRGKRFTATRGKGDKARVAYGVLPEWQQFTSSKLPQDKDPVKTLMKLWGFEDIGDGPADGPAVPLAS